MLNQSTGIQLVLGAVTWYIALFVVFSYIPISGAYVESGSVEDVEWNFSGNESYDADSNIDIFAVFTGLFTFSLTGDSVPWYLSLICAWFPAFILGFGVYSIIRGI